VMYEDECLVRDMQSLWFAEVWFWDSFKLVNGCRKRKGEGKRGKWITLNTGTGLRF